MEAKECQIGSWRFPIRWKSSKGMWKSIVNCVNPLERFTMKRFLWSDFSWKWNQMNFIKTCIFRSVAVRQLNFFKIHSLFSEVFMGKSQTKLFHFSCLESFTYIFLLFATPIHPTWKRTDLTSEKCSWAWKRMSEEEAAAVANNWKNMLH